MCVEGIDNHLKLSLMKVALACKAVLRQNSDTMKILALSDQVEERIYSLAGQGHFREVGLVLGCGDLPYAYLEYLVSALNVPMFYVPGNHDPQENPRLVSTRAEGGSNLDLKPARASKDFCLPALAVRSAIVPME